MQNKESNLIQLNSVEVNFDGFKAVNEFNFGVSAGELRCLIGPNGAGKTTVLDIICGKTKSSKGSIIFNGEDITNKEEFESTNISPNAHEKAAIDPTDKSISPKIITIVIPNAIIPKTITVLIIF